MTKQIGNTDYEVTDDGYIFSRKTNKFISTVKNKSGGVKVNLYYDKKNHQEYVSKLVADAFIEKPSNTDEKDLVVGHKDYNDENNRVSNLYWTTKKELINKMHGEGKYDEHHASWRRKIKLIDRENGIEMKFNSLMEAAVYLKSINAEIEIMSALSNLSSALKRDGKCYNFFVESVL